MVKKKEVDQEMAGRLKRLLEQKGVNKAKIARRGGIGHYTQMMKGERPINSKALKGIAATPEMGVKAVAWVLLGQYEEETFTTVNKYSGPSLVSTESTNIEEDKPKYQLSEEILALQKKLILIKREDLVAYEWLVEKINDQVDLLQYKKNKQDT